MAATCPRCGAQNPDGNAFCQQCGSALVAPPAPQPPARSAPPARPAPSVRAAPPAVQQPPTGPQPPPLPPVAPPHVGYRLSRNAIIAIAAVAILVVAGAVIAFAAIKHGPNVPPTPTAPPRPPTSAPTSAPTSRPTVAPSATSAPSGQTLDAGFAAISVPQGATVAQQSQGHVEIDVSNANAGQFFFDAEQPPSGVTDSTSLLNQQLSAFQNSQGNTAVDWCPNGGAPSQSQLTGDSGAISAQDGLICGTASSQNGQTYQFIAEVIGAYVNGANGPEAIIFTFYSTPELFTSQQQKFETPILHGTVWHGVA